MLDAVPLRVSRMPVLKFAQQSRVLIFFEMLACAVVIGVVDMRTGYEVRLLPFYAVPIFVSGWFCGKYPGLILAAIAGGIWWWTNYLTGDPDLHGWMRIWETFRHIGSFLLVALTGSALRSRSDIAAARIALLERSERLERQVVEITESEQRRIGQDLHDGLCQDLAALSCAAASLRDDLRQLHLSPEAERADELAMRLRDAVVQTRDLAHGLAPAHVSQLGIVLALESLAQAVTRLENVHCTFDCDDTDVQCDKSSATNLYRIAQEAINNAVRHGGARNISLQLFIAGEWLTLRVADDGFGFYAPATSGTGLNIMEYRARLNGGDLTIGSGEEGGTVVVCRVRRTPVEPEAAVASPAI